LQILAQDPDTGVGMILGAISLRSHLDPFLNGILDTKDIFFYLSFIVFILFVTYQVLDSRRWR